MQARAPAPPDSDTATAPVPQAIGYGVQFGGIYDALFPIDGDAEDAAARLGRLGRAGSAAGSRYVEFGVGTGRVAFPLAARGGAVVGVDLSRDLLRRAAHRRAATGLAVGLVQADIRDFVPAEPVDAAYCVCATISMLSGPAEHQRVIDNLAAAVGPGGHVVVETHSPDRIRLLHRDADTVSFRTPLPGSDSGMATEAHLDAAGRWTVSYRWTDPEPRSAEEFSVLIEPAELAAMARRAGLEPVVTTSSWTEDRVDPTSPTYISVFRKPPSQAGRPRRSP